MKVALASLAIAICLLHSCIADDAGTLSGKSLSDLMATIRASHESDISSTKAEIKDLKSGTSKLEPRFKKSRLVSLQKRLIELQKASPSAPEMRWEVGSWGTVDSNLVDMRIVSVSGPSDAIARASFFQAIYRVVGNQQQYNGRKETSSQRVVLRGFNTAAFADGNVIVLPKILAITGVAEIDGKRLLVIESPKD